MKRLTQNSDEIRPTNIVATLADYDTERENERQRVQHLLDSCGAEEDNATESQNVVSDNPVLELAQSSSFVSHPQPSTHLNLVTEAASVFKSTHEHLIHQVERKDAGSHMNPLNIHSPFASQQGTRHHCIAAMELYSRTSFEELRFEDYIVGRIGRSDNTAVVRDAPTPLSLCNSVPGWLTGNQVARVSTTSSVLDGGRTSYRTVNVDREVIQLLTNHQIFNLVNEEILAKVVNCVKTTGEVSIMGPSEGDIQKAVDCIKMKIAQCHREPPEEKAYICAKAIVGSCHLQQCRMLHSPLKLPYLWQVRLFDHFWKRLDRQEEIEMAFCDNNDSFSARQMGLEHEGIALILHQLIFDAVPYARVQVFNGDGAILSLECRRLTTASYIEVDGRMAGFETQWRWYWNEHTQWKLYEPSALQHTLEEKFLAGQRDYHFFRGAELQMYRIMFNRMQQVNVSTGNTRDIHRRPAFVSSGDVLMNKFPWRPTPVPPNATQLPPSWVLLDHGNPFELVRFSEDSQAFTDISNGFFTTVERAKWEIDSIYWLQNPSLWSSFCNQEKIMEEKTKRESLPKGVDKRHLYHGTDCLDSVYGICVNNFDFRISGKNATVHGHGAYFAKTASFSHRYTQPQDKPIIYNTVSRNSDKPTRYMFVASVLVGRYTKGNSSYRRPPNKPGSMHELFDSCVNDENKPTIFVIFDKTQCYPEYLIKYH